MGGKKLAASFMMVLIITLPVYTSFVFAGIGYGEVYAHGNNDLKGFIKTGEPLKVKITQVAITGVSSVTEEYLWLHPPTTAGPPNLFSSCNSDIPPDCAFTSSAVNPWASGTQQTQWKVDFYYDIGQNNFAGSSSEFSFVVDGQPPIITFSSVEQSANKLKLKFKVEDKPNSCAGVQDVTIKGNTTDTSLAELNYTVYARQCTNPVDFSSIAFTLLYSNLQSIALSGEVNNVRLCIDANDRLSCLLV